MLQHRQMKGSDIGCTYRWLQQHAVLERLSALLHKEAVNGGPETTQRLFCEMAKVRQGLRSLLQLDVFSLMQQPLLWLLLWLLLRLLLLKVVLLFFGSIPSVVQVGLLIEELISLDVWKEKVLPLLRGAKHHSSIAAYLPVRCYFIAAPSLALAAAAARSLLLPSKGLMMMMMMMMTMMIMMMMMMM